MEDGDNGKLECPQNISEMFLKTKQRSEHSERSVEQARDDCENKRWHLAELVWFLL